MTQSSVSSIKCANATQSQMANGTTWISMAFARAQLKKQLVISCYLSQFNSFIIYSLILTISLFLSIFHLNIYQFVFCTSSVSITLLRLSHWFHLLHFLIFKVSASFWHFCCCCILSSVSLCVCLFLRSKSP